MSTPFDELKLTGNLPSPSGVGMAILRLTRNDDFRAEDLAKTIQSDPALTGRVVKMSNSVSAGGVTQITGVAEAVVRLGIRAVRNIALGFSLVSSYRKGKCTSFNFGQFWAGSLARAIAAQALARATRTTEPAEAYICALLSGIGRLALASVHPNPYSELLDRCVGFTETALARAEKDVFGIDHLEVAEAMFEDWHLPQAHGKAVVAFVGPPEDDTDLGRSGNALRDLLRVVAPIADMVVAEEEDRPRLRKALEPSRNAIKMDAATFNSLGDTLVSEWQEWGKVLSVPTQNVAPFAELLELADQAPEEKKSEDPARRVFTADIDAASLDSSNNEELGRLTVMAVDDDPVSLRLLVAYLKKSEFDVFTATDGMAALTLALEKNPHIVVTDWMMPKMNGVELTRSLRKTEIGRDMYILLLTGREEEDRVVEAFDAGVDDFVTKPANPRILLSRVHAGERLVRLQDKVAQDKERMKRQMARMAVLNRKLTQTSVTDALTELPNRRHAMACLKEEFDRRDSQKRGRMSLVMFDLDYFKNVNDVYGHDTGDAVLVEISKLFQSKLRKGDTICRIGGEEFLVICPGSDAAGAAKVAERLRTAAEGHIINHGSFSQSITCSFGVAECAEDFTSLDELLKAADLSVYKSKEAGRNRVTVFGEPVATG
ncbi:MAG: diguanylate cyclase [Planctomycetota bacterium]